jgi:hypothetical protein
MESTSKDKINLKELRMTRFVISFGLTLFLCSGISYAQTGTPGVTGRQVTQHERIREGRKNGELTRAESKRLRNEQHRIELEKRMAMADGTVSPGERRFLHREQRRANRHIHRQKHDRQSR